MPKGHGHAGSSLGLRRRPDAGGIARLRHRGALRHHLHRPARGGPRGGHPPGPGESPGFSAPARAGGTGQARGDRLSRPGQGRRAAGLPPPGGHSAGGGGTAQGGRPPGEHHPGLRHGAPPDEHPGGVVLVPGQGDRRPLLAGPAGEPRRRGARSPRPGQRRHGQRGALQPAHGRGGPAHRHRALRREPLRRVQRRLQDDRHRTDRLALHRLPPLPRHHAPRRLAGGLPPFPHAPAVPLHR